MEVEGYTYILRTHPTTESDFFSHGGSPFAYRPPNFLTFC